MIERRRIRLAAVPYKEEEVDDGKGHPKNMRRLAFKDEGAYEEPSIEKPTQRRVTKVDAGSTARRNISKRPARQPLKTSTKSKQRGPAEKSNNLLEELENTTWSLLKCGRKLIEKSIEEGKVHALRAAIRLRQEHDSNFRPRKGRANPKRRAKKRSRKRSEFGLALNPSSSDESRSINSGSSCSSHTTSANGASIGEPSMSLSVSSSKSSKKREGSKSSKSKLNADASFDSLGENSIIADDSDTTKISSPSQDSSTDHANSEDDRSIVSGVIGAWTAIKQIVEKSEAASANRREEQVAPHDSMRMEVFLESETSDSWIDSIKTDSDESFSTALNKELSYHRQMPSTMLEHRINEIRDVSTKGHQRQPTVELSDAEFLKVIRETVNREIDSKQNATRFSDIDILKALEKSTESDQAPNSPSTLSNNDFLKAMQRENGVEEGAGSSLPEPILSNAEFLKAMQQENGIEAEFSPGTSASLNLFNIIEVEAEDETDKTPATAQILSNADFLKAMQKENGVATPAAAALGTTPPLSNGDFLKAMQQENGVEEEIERTPSTTQLLSNAEFLKAIQEENGVADESKASQATTPPLSNGEFLKATQEESTKTSAQRLVLSEHLSNADFLEAMKQSLSATGGKFEQNPTLPSVDACSVPEYEEDRDMEMGLSDWDFLKALKTSSLMDQDSISGNKPSIHADMNENFLSALKHLGGIGHGDTSMFNQGQLETIQEVGSDYSKSAQSSPATSPPTSYTLTEEAVLVMMKTDGSLSEDSTYAGDPQPDICLLSKQQDGSGRRVEQIEQTNPGQVTHQKDLGQGNELPDLKSVSSDESDTNFDPLPGVLGEKDDIDDGDTGFMTAVEVLAEDDTNFFSTGGDDGHFFSEVGDIQETERDAIGSSDSLDEILSERNRAEELAPMKSQEAVSIETGDDESDEGETEVEIRMEQGMVDEETICTNQADAEQAITHHSDRYMEEAEFEWRQDESPLLLAEESSDDDTEERKALIRAIQVDESLTCEEKALLINEIESGVSLDESSCGEIDVIQAGDRDAPEQSRMEINQAIGKKVIQGWILLDSTCPQCVLPLMTDGEATEAICIFCDYSRSMNGGNGTKTGALAPPPPPPPIANKKPKDKRTRISTKEMSVNPPNSRVVSE